MDIADEEESLPLSARFLVIGCTLPLVRRSHSRADSGEGCHWQHYWEVDSTINVAAQDPSVLRLGDEDVPRLPDVGTHQRLLKRRPPVLT